MIRARSRNDYHLYMDRYSTWEEAEIGHQKAVDYVKQGLINKEDYE